MKDAIKTQGWIFIQPARGAYFPERCRAEGKIVLLVHPGKVLVNGILYHSSIIPTVDEAIVFLADK